MAPLADDPATAGWILRPVIRRDGTGVDGVDQRERLGAASQQVVHLPRQGRKPAVESDHQVQARHSARKPSRLRQLFPRFSASGFSDKHVFARLQRLDDHTSVAVMAGGDENGVEISGSSMIVR